MQSVNYWSTCSSYLNNNEVTTATPPCTKHHPFTNPGQLSFTLGVLLHSAHSYALVNLHLTIILQRTKGHRKNGYQYRATTFVKPY